VQPSKSVSSPSDEPIELATVTPSPSNSLLYSFASLFSMPTGPPQTCIDTDVMYPYFEFLETGQWTHILPEDFKFLEYKGCFHLPSRLILDDLVREYFLHVHPLLPIINEGEFWEMYDPRVLQITRNKIPLFVFRAMLFASCSVCIAFQWRMVQCMRLAYRIVCIRCYHPPPRISECHRSAKLHVSPC
jgi:hypothetical protein